MNTKEITYVINGITQAHYPAVRQIYLDGIATGQATFETKAPSWEDWDKGHLQHSRIIAEKDGVVMGWAALSPVSGRCVYGGVAEVSVYIANDYRGQGVGSRLLNELIKTSEANNIWTLQAGIFPENKASLALHEKNGFRTIGYRERIGKMGDTWRDTVLLERRSKVTGN
jgi:phosphinothricin acetyltransferase